MSSNIDPIWAAEFRGLFWGEGNFMIDVYERTINGYRSFTPRCRCRVLARDDNREMLDNVLHVLGGHIYNHKTFKQWWANGKEYTHHACLVWQVQGLDDVSRVLDVLDGGLIPSKKAREMPIMREAVRLMRLRQHGYTEEQRQAIRDIQQQLFALRQYDVDKVQSSG